MNLRYFRGVSENKMCQNFSIHFNLYHLIITLSDNYFQQTVINSRLMERL